MTGKKPPEKPDTVSEALGKAEETASEVRHQTTSTLENKDSEHLVSIAKEYIENRCGYWQFVEDTDSLINDTHKEAKEWEEYSEDILDSYTEAVRQIYEIGSIDNQKLTPEMKEALSVMVSKIDPELMGRIKKIYDEIYEAAQELMVNAFNSNQGIRYLVEENHKGEFKPCAAHEDLMSLLKRMKETSNEVIALEQEFSQCKRAFMITNKEYAAYMRQAQKIESFKKFTNIVSTNMLCLEDLYKQLKSALQNPEEMQKTMDIFVTIVKIQLDLMHNGISSQTMITISDFTDIEGIQYVQETEAERAKIFMDTFLMCMIALKMLREQRKWMNN